MRKVLKSMLQDSHDKSVSSKRVVTFVAFILCSIGFIGNLFFNLHIDPNIYNSMMYIVVAGLGFTASEKFASKDKTSDNYDYTPTKKPKRTGTPP
jgi:hypothetical protein